MRGAFTEINITPGRLAQEAGEEIMGISAPELKELENTPEHEAQMRSVNFKHLLFKMKLAEDDYQDDWMLNRVRGVSTQEDSRQVLPSL